MELKEKITLDRLNKDSVSILKQQFIELNGTETQVGENIRNTYSNTQTEREQLKTLIPAEYYSAVLAVWGDTPTVAEPEERD